MTKRATPSFDTPLAWLLAPANELSRVLGAALEIRGSDDECVDALSSDDPLTPEEARKIYSLVQLLRGMNMDPEAVRAVWPGTMEILERTCLGCTARERCDHDLKAGIAAQTHHEFCPNADRLASLEAAVAAPR
jgi:hypothetical protein